MRTRLKAGDVTRDAVLAVIAAAPGRSFRRAEIIEALGVKGNHSGQIAVDNRLRELKHGGHVAHEARAYRLPG